MPIPETRISLIQRLTDRRDSAAWDEFCSIYERVIYSMARKYGLQDADAREISQDVLLAISRKIGDFDPRIEGRFRSWLATIARNAAIDLLRKNRKTTSGGSDIQRLLQNAQVTDETQLFELETQREQFRWAAQKVCETTSESTWRAFWMTAVEGLTAETAALRLGMSVGSVYVARCRTLAKIKQLVEPFREHLT